MAGEPVTAYKLLANLQGHLHYRNRPLGAVPLDGVSAAAIEGTVDQMWS
jgi:hypothetical protein